MTDAMLDLVGVGGQHLIHPLHHPVDNQDRVIWVCGEDSTTQCEDEIDRLECEAHAAARAVASAVC